MGTYSIYKNRNAWWCGCICWGWGGVGGGGGGWGAIEFSSHLIISNSLKTGQNDQGWRMLRPGHTALYGLITAKTHQKVFSHEADHVVRVDAEFKTSFSQLIDMAGRGGKSERRRMRQKVWTLQNFSPRTTTGGTRGKDVQHVKHTW